MHNIDENEIMNTHILIVNYDLFYFFIHHFWFVSMRFCFSFLFDYLFILFHFLLIPVLDVRLNRNTSAIIDKIVGF